MQDLQLNRFYNFTNEGLRSKMDKNYQLFRSRVKSTDFQVNVFLEYEYKCQVVEEKTL